MFLELFGKTTNLMINATLVLLQELCARTESTGVYLELKRMRKVQSTEELQRRALAVSNAA